MSTLRFEEQQKLKKLINDKKKNLFRGYVKNITIKKPTNLQQLKA